MIATFSPQSALTSVDLPTLGRPATATTPSSRAPSYGAPRPTTHSIVTPKFARLGDTASSRNREGRLHRSSLEIGRARTTRAGAHRRSSHDPLAVPEDDSRHPHLCEPLPAAAARGRGHRRATKSPGRYPRRSRARTPSAPRRHPSGYAAFSTLTPSITRPSPRSTAQPTWKYEYGAYARAASHPPPRAARVGHAENPWKTASVTSAPSVPPDATSERRSARRLDTRLGDEQGHDEGQGRDEEPVRGVVQHERNRHPAGEGDRGVPGRQPPRSGVPRPEIAFTAITPMTVSARRRA